MDVCFVSSRDVVSCMKKLHTLNKDLELAGNKESKQYIDSNLREYRTLLSHITIFGKISKYMLIGSHYSSLVKLRSELDMNDEDVVYHEVIATASQAKEDCNKIKEQNGSEDSIKHAEQKVKDTDEIERAIRTRMCAIKNPIGYMCLYT